MVFVPVAEYNCAVDLLALGPDGATHGIQVKYSTDGSLNDGVVGYNGKRTKYSDNSFDYYGVYLPEMDVVVYPSIRFRGCSIAQKVRKAGDFYWYEDFLNFTDDATRRSCKYFEPQNTAPKKRVIREDRHKVKRPSPEELTRLVWSHPITQVAQMFGVSDNGIRRWMTDANVVGPPRGHWLKGKKPGQ